MSLPHNLHSAGGRPRVLIADDQVDIHRALRLLLGDLGYELDCVTSPNEAIAAAESHSYDLALVDLNYTRDTTSGREGLTLLEVLRATDSLLPIVVMTAWGSVDGAVRAMQLGARDYIQKPWDDQRLTTLIRTQVEWGQAVRERRRLEAAQVRAQGTRHVEFLTDSPIMRRVLSVVERVAPSDACVLVTGEHGTGKDVVARWIHARSRRAAKPFVPVNAGGMSEGIAESELFGHTRGAFTDAKSDRVGCFEMADGGTLFLDEIANMPLKMQAKLLRVLQTGELQRVGSSRVERVDVRVVSASNADLLADVTAGRFREDLLYRLNTVEVHLPPLRDRGDDVLLLARHYLAAFGGRYGKALSGFDESAEESLLLHSWPGNVRELAHAVERAVLLTDSGVVTARDLNLRAPRNASRATPSVGADPLRSLDDAERAVIERVIESHGGNVALAAAELGVSRSTLYRRLQRYEASGAPATESKSSDDDARLGRDAGDS